MLFTNDITFAAFLHISFARAHVQVVLPRRLAWSNREFNQLSSQPAETSNDNADGVDYKWCHQSSGASCTLQMKENGEIYNERIFRSSGSHAVDQAALYALRESAPFKDASDPLVYEKQILVEFRGDVSKSDAQVVTMKLISNFQPRAAAK
jgi:hypothetical protein